MSWVGSGHETKVDPTPYGDVRGSKVNLHWSNCMLHKVVLCGLVVCCGLLVKWLRISVRVRLGPGNAPAVLFFPVAICNCGEHLSSFGMQSR